MNLRQRKIIDFQIYNTRMPNSYNFILWAIDKKILWQLSM